jgi:hypothetical protein
MLVGPVISITKEQEPLKICILADQAVFQNETKENLIKKEAAQFCVAFLLRREGSNLRPSGYEPDELPLLYFAIWAANVRLSLIIAKHFLYLTFARS